MIVKSIELINFKSYYGKAEFSFTEGLNIISGHEGSGKSNLFDAFMWVLFKRVSGMKKDETLDEQNTSYINDKARSEVFSKKSDEVIVCEVKIKIIVPKSLKRQTEREYEIIRRKNIFLNKDYNKNRFFDEHVWSCSNSDLVIKWEDEKHNHKELENVEAEVELDNIFPEKIRKYIWFQGEQLNELLDFDNENTLKRAIDYISYLPSYEYMERLIGEVDRQLNVRVKNIISSNNRDSKKFDLINGELEKIKKSLDVNKELLKKKKQELDKLIEEEEEQNSKLSLLAGFPDLKEKEGKHEGELKNAIGKVSNLSDREKELFTGKWMLKGTVNLFEEAEKEISKFSQYRRDLVFENNKQLEEGVPGDSLINEMLEKKHCIICDRPAPEGSKEFATIKSHLDSNKELNPLSPEIESLNDKLVDIKSIPSKIKNRLYNIDREIVDHQNKIQESLHERHTINERLKEVQSKIEETVREKGHSILNLNPENISSSIRRIRSDISTLRRRIDTLKEEIFKGKNAEAEKIKELKKLKKPDQEEILEETLTEYTEFIKKLVENQTEKEKYKLISKIQETANALQKKIAEVNNVVVVYIKINPEDYTLEFVDSEGNPNPGHGAQNTLAKMSIINAIVKLSNEQKGEDYPFIADAPTSEFGEDFTERFIESISHTYSQSIIISKDLYRNIEKYRKEAFVNRVIEIIKESEGKEATTTNSYSKRK